tara:strand:- start:59 stop:274 length:216 start_codon:yes stop_codon:yes gene_type:complete
VINKRHLSILDEIKKSGGEIDSGKPNDSVLLIDGMNTFIRVFSAIPTTNEDSSRWWNSWFFKVIGFRNQYD